MDKNILDVAVVDDFLSIYSLMAVNLSFGKKGHRLCLFHQAKDLLKAVEDGYVPSAVFVDLELRGNLGADISEEEYKSLIGSEELIDTLRKMYPKMPIATMSSYPYKRDKTDFCLNQIELSAMSGDELEKRVLDAIETRKQWDENNSK